MTSDWMDNDDDAGEALIVSAAPLLGSPVPAQPKPALGRPKGSTSSNRKQIALRIPKRVIDYYKAGGPGWQTRMIEVLEREAAGT